jgi:hypothetical protein
MSQYKIDIDDNLVKIKLLGDHAKQEFINNAVTNKLGKSNDENLYALISLEYIDEITKYKWYLGKSGYPVAYNILGYGILPLHHYVGYLIYGIDGMQQIKKNKIVIDHINRNRLDNRNENLRLCNSKENGYNKSKKKFDGTIDYIKYKGVIKNKDGTYSAQISKEGKKTTIKDIKTMEEAAEIYNLMAEELFGEFSSKNIIN